MSHDSLSCNCLQDGLRATRAGGHRIGSTSTTTSYQYHLAFGSTSQLLTLTNQDLTKVGWAMVNSAHGLGLMSVTPGHLLTVTPPCTKRRRSEKQMYTREVTKSRKHCLFTCPAYSCTTYQAGPVPMTRF